jgi:hypothetical protein
MIIHAPTEITTKPLRAKEAGEIDLKTHTWLTSVLWSAGLLTFLANWLLYGLSPGIGWCLFFAVLWAAILKNRDLTGLSRSRRRRDGLVLAAMAMTLVQFGMRASFSSGMCLILLTFYLAGHLLFTDRHPWWRRFAEQVWALTVAPFRWAQAGYWLSNRGWKKMSDSTNEKPTTARFARLAGIVAPSAIAAVFFLVLLGKGNAILGEVLNGALNSLLSSLENVEFPSAGRVVFLLVVSTILLGLLWRSRRSLTLGWLDCLCERASEKGSLVLKDASSGIWRMRLLLVVVNLIFFAANSIDISYLWSGVELPEGMTISKFVHSGTYSLIASVVLAALVLSVLFQQHREITQARAQWFLAMLWIGQNLLLLGNVLLRVKFYVDAYQLSVLRLHLGLFLALVAVGFVLLAIRVVQQRSLSWLIGANMLAVFVLFFSLQFWDTRKSVARYNVVQAAATPEKSVDLYYLSELGPSAWGILRDLEAGAVEGLENLAPDAGSFMDAIRKKEVVRMEGESWREFQLQRTLMRRVIAVE